MQNVPGLVHARRPGTKDTPLHVAASLGHVDMVSYLVERGSDIRAVNARGATPADLAIMYLRTQYEPYTRGMKLFVSKRKFNIKGIRVHLASTLNCYDDPLLWVCDSPPNTLNNVS